MTIDDNYISNLFFGNRQIKHAVYKKYITNEFSKSIINYLDNRFADGNHNYKEIIYRIKYNFEKTPCCLTCGASVKFVAGKNVYNKFCSAKCAQNNKEVRDKRYKTSVEKYGYGCNLKKMKETCVEKYGVENVYQTEWCKEKIKQSTFERFGVDNYGKTKEHIIATHTPEVNKQRNDTKRKRHTFNTSTTEDKSYILLQQYFNKVYRNFSTDLYPFQCDFYIPEKDLYIECNYHWTHGGHPFDENNQEDIDRLNKLKSKNTKYYDIAIHTWTSRDINKRNIAKENKLNYIEVWKYNELEQWLSENFTKLNIDN